MNSLVDKYVNACELQSMVPVDPYDMIVPGIIISCYIHATLELLDYVVHNILLVAHVYNKHLLKFALKSLLYKIIQ